MYGEVNQDYASLLKEAAGYARRQISSQSSVADQATHDQQMRQWILIGGAGLAGVLLLVLIMRKT